MSRNSRARLQRIEERRGAGERGIVVIEAQDGDEAAEEAAIAEAKASGLAFEGDGFVVIRRFSNGPSSFTPYRIGDVPALMRQVAENGRKIFPGPNCEATG